MHAQRCPVAKLLASNKQNNQGKVGNIPSFANPNRAPHIQKRGQSFKSILPSQEKFKLSNKKSIPKNQEPPSFFQKLHGDVAPLITPCPQMYSDDNWVQPFKKETPTLKDKTHSKLPPLLNEKCAIHGNNVRRGSRPVIFPKSISCPTPSHIGSRQTANAERLKNWRRSSLTITKVSRDYIGSPHVVEHQHEPSPPLPPPPLPPSQSSYRHYNLSHQYRSPVLSMTSTPRSSPSTPSLMTLAKTGISSDLQNKRSQFRKAWSFFSIGCDDIPKEKPPPQRILRQPTRHVYRRGISGLPIECTNRRSMGVAF